MRALTWGLLATFVLVTGCRKEVSSLPQPSKTGEVAVIDTSAPFSPPEIRRTRDSSGNDTVAPSAGEAAKAVSPTHQPSPEAVKPGSGDVATKPAATAAAAPAKPVAAPVAPLPARATPTIPVKTAPVSVQPTTTPASSVKPGEVGEWVIQVDIYKSEEDAKRGVAKFAAKGIPTYILQAAANAGLSGSYWRVRVGRFLSRADAQTYGDQVLKPAGTSFWIDRKSNEARGAGGN